ncbi:hypothetical protein Btru_025890 [Bulinus truncatus]|nr:hypothetical protein Btru_025890 [Bulinus truncatus]
MIVGVLHQDYDNNWCVTMCPVSSGRGGMKLGQVTVPCPTLKEPRDKLIRSMFGTLTYKLIRSMFGTLADKLIWSMFGTLADKLIQSMNSYKQTHSVNVWKTYRHSVTLTQYGNTMCPV